MGYSCYTFTQKMYKITHTKIKLCIPGTFLETHCLCFVRFRLYPDSQRYNFVSLLEQSTFIIPMHVDILVHISCALSIFRNRRGRFLLFNTFFVHSYPFISTYFITVSSKHEIYNKYCHQFE